MASPHLEVEEGQAGPWEEEEAEEGELLVVADKMECINLPIDLTKSKVLE